MIEGGNMKKIIAFICSFLITNTICTYTVSNAEDDTALYELTSSLGADTDYLNIPNFKHHVQDRAFSHEVYLRFLENCTNYEASNNPEGELFMGLSGGLCYGISAVQMLSHNGVISPSDIVNGAETLCEISYSPETDVILSGYHTSQVYYDNNYLINYRPIEINSRTQCDELIKTAERNMAENRYFVILYAGDNAHAVTGIGIADGSWKYGGVEFDKCILTLDSNSYILEQRAMKNSDERQIALSTKSQAMLSGVMFCAHCGGRMTSNMHTEKYTVKSTGEVKEKHYLRYICYHRSRKLCDCDGQSVYSAEKVDKAVIEVVASIFSKISDAPDETELRKEYNKEMQKCRAKQTKLGTELKKYQKQYDKLNEEIANTLIGESFYSPEQLSTAMTTVQQRITAINQQLEKIGNEMEQKKASMEKVRPMYEMFKGWAEEFRMATIEQKKMIISQVISRIEIGKGYKINIMLNMEYEQFCEGWNGLNNL